MKSLFSGRDIRALLVFLPLVVVVFVTVYFLRPKVEAEVPATVSEHPESPVADRHHVAAESDRIELFRFDPNTIDYRGLRRLGLTQHQAASLLRYRAGGKVFRIREDVATCYGISDSLYFRLEPYIRIGRKYAVAPRGYRTERVVTRPPLDPEPFLVDTVSALYLEAIGALSRSQARTFVKWRNLHGIRDMEDFRMSYVITDSLAEALEPYLLFNDPSAPVEINRADSTVLRSVYGIGEKSVRAILRYRERLGGFCRVEQLTEIPEVTERNYERIVQQICCDSCEIQKIDINFASPNVLAVHPYMPPRILRKLLKIRQLKGGWANIGEMMDDNILTKDEAARLAPYLQFDTDTYVN